VRARGHSDLRGKSKTLTTEDTGRIKTMVETGLAPSQGVRRNIRGIGRPRPKRGEPRVYDNDD